MEEKYKFELGQKVRHASTNKHSGVVMVIMAYGTMTDNDGECNLYHVSAQRSQHSDNQSLFFAHYMQEKELVAHEGE